MIRVIGFILYINVSILYLCCMNEYVGPPTGLNIEERPPTLVLSG
jgi:hypothetical protein